jgi:hypothetical protein
MELPLVSSLLPIEGRAAVEFAQGDDPKLYGKYYHFPFAMILDVAHRLPPTVKGELPDGCDMGAANWNEWLKGYSAWAVPDDAEEEDFTRRMTRMMKGDSLYSKYSKPPLEKPQVQLRKLFAAPIVRKLAEFSTTDLYQQMANKLFVLKIAVHPENSSTKRDAFDRCLDPDFKVWRLVTVHGDTNLDSFHDQIIGPAMGWRRHYHAYEFTIPTSGAVFGPVNSDSIDMMHVMTQGDYMLNAEDYDIRHVLRKQGDRLGYVYDLGDCWKHIITVLDIVEKGTVLTAKTFSADAEMQATWKKQVKGSITVTGNHLLAGEINCPPEDSNGCDEMGDYGSILMKGPHHIPSNRAVNWTENLIHKAKDFDLSKHQKRFKEAIKSRKNPTDGNLKFMHKMSGASFLGDSKQKGRTVMQGHTMGSAAHEIVGRKKNKERCNACGKQKGSNSSLKLFDCSRCKTVAYCGRDCQKQDWKMHKQECASASTTAK